MDRRVYLYAFNDLVKIVDVKYLQNEAITISNLNRLADLMRAMNPEKITIYAIDNRRGLHKAFDEAMRSNDFSNRIIFADMVRREGKEY